MSATKIKRNERKRRLRSSNGILKKAGELKGCGVRIYIAMQDETNGHFTIYNSENSTGDSSWPPAPEDINKTYPPPKFVVPQLPPILEIHSAGGRDTEFVVRQPPVLEIHSAGGRDTEFVVRQPPVLEIHSAGGRDTEFEVLQPPILQPPILKMAAVYRGGFFTGGFLEEAF
ncbi:hypothetical protein FPQ18DRAFT_47095 [Pyronema domesticum]|nr:hypothetical protein FPQ18DRAFT_47095 [Pyronema domesticum]